MEEMRELKKSLQEQGRTGLALDIDETLSDTGPHWWDHMMKFHVPQGMSYEQLLKEFKFIEDVPEWSTEAAKDHIAKTLESNEFNETIPLLHESNVMVNKLDELIPVVAYITARPDSVRRGTERWLEKHGFPKAPVILRPGKPGYHGLATKNTWKAELLKELYPNVMGIIDDNPGLLDALADIDYQGTVYLYGALWSEQFRPPTDRE